MAYRRVLLGIGGYNDRADLVAGSPGLSQSLGDRGLRQPLHFWG